MGFFLPLNSLHRQAAKAVRQAKPNWPLWWWRRWWWVNLQRWSSCIQSSIEEWTLP